MTSMVRLVAATLLLCSSIASAQYQARTWGDWKTVETARFSVHFPSELENWARSVAARIEGVDSLVGRVVGYTPPRRVHIVIDDPYRISNGSAWPFLDKPALVLWATPPNPREDIGTYVTWADMLAAHEFAHLAHLTRPSRNPLVAGLWNLLPVDLGPIGRKTPRWMVEGYATYVEGVVTGSGRPNGSWRPAILRQWAIEGALPTYGQLNSAGGMYGGDFAYLAGSAFIDWLVARRGDSSLVDLWRRMTARQNRGFDAAFTGVYGEPPSILYGRFVAEITDRAMELRRRIVAASPDSGRVVQHLAWETGDPAISTDGGRVAILLQSGTRPGRVVIWNTLPEPDTVARRVDALMLKRDPEDVAPIRIFPPSKKALSTLGAVGNQPYQGPRFFRDGRVLVWRNAAVGDGSYAPDLFIWDPQRKTVKRLTRAANIRQGDPAPDGRAAAALRCAGGHCDLVSVDVATGSVRTVAAGSDTRSFHRPRFSPDGRSVLASVHQDGFWQIGVIAAATGSVQFITSGPANFYDASFVDDSTIIATTDANGIPTIVRLSTGGGALRVIANVTGAAVGAEVNHAEHSVWFLALHARGWDVRSAPLNSSTPLSGQDVQMSSRPTPVALPAAPVGNARPYGAGPRKWIYAPGTTFSDEGASLIAALVNSDIAGRHELLYQWQGGLDNSWQGSSIALTSRATRAPWTLSGFMVRQEAGALTSVLHGGAFSVEIARRLEIRSYRLNLGGSVSDLSTPTATGLRSLAYATTALGLTRFRDGVRSGLQLALTVNSGRSGPFSVTRGTVTAALESSAIPFTASGTLGYAQTDSPFEQFTIGGLTPVLIHPTVLSQRIAMPVLPTALATGRKLSTYRITIPLAGFRAYHWAGRVWDFRVPGQSLIAAGRVPWQKVAGVEWAGSIPQISAIGTPSARITAGFGRWMNAPSAYTPVVIDGLEYGVRPHSPTQFYVMTQFGDWAR